MIAFDVARREITHRFQEAGNVIGEKPHLRDWSEVLVMAAAIYSLRAAILQRRKNVKTLKNANLWVFGVLVVTEIRIRQLWITRTLDDEAKRFKGSNEALRKEIQDLTGQNTRLQDEMKPLKQQVTSLAEAEKRLQQDILRRQKVADAQDAELEGFRKIISGLRDDDGAVESDTASLQAYVVRLQDEERRLNGVGEKVQRELQALVDGKRKLVDKEIELNLREEALAKREAALGKD